MTANLNLTGGTYYIIRIRERLDEEWSDWFESMTISMDEEGTTLRGYLPDQAALHGIIGRVQRLGLQLVAVNQGCDGETFDKGES